jgi:ferredoxin-type protein NapF
MSAAPDRSRRALLFARQQAELPLRPPWALAESEFIDRCTGCGACIERCPEQVLTRGAGGYAIFDPHLGECTFCSDCEQACVPRALDREAVPDPWKQLAAIGEGCLPRHGVVCSSCRDACPEQAIVFPLTSAMPTPSLDAARCTGCGACVGVCPVGAITLQRFDEETT